MPTNIGLVTPGSSALVSGLGSWLIIEQFPEPPPPPPIPPIPPGTPLGSFRFLKDHFVDGEYILTGEVRNMFGPWQPTPDVEPLDALATEWFYSRGPRLPGCLRTIFSNRALPRPVTYWRSVSPNVWGLTGLGAAMSTVPAVLERIEDKEV